MVIHAAEYQCTSRARSVVHVAVATGSRVVVVGSRERCLVTPRESPEGYIRRIASFTLDTVDHGYRRWIASAVAEKVQGERGEYRDRCDSYSRTYPP